MEWIVVLSLFLSTVNLYFLLKKMSTTNTNNELQEFRNYTESLITEFNRITTRNVSLLDSRIEELNHKIKLSQKIDALLKERFEEANKLEHLKALKLNEIYHIDQQTKIAPLSVSLDPDNNISLPEQEEIITDENNTIIENEHSIPSEQSLFEGIPVEKLKKHTSKNNKNSQIEKESLLMQSIKENKSKEELLNLGFSSNEINIALLLYSTNNSQENNK